MWSSNPNPRVPSMLEAIDIKASKPVDITGGAAQPNILTGTPNMINTQSISDSPILQSALKTSPFSTVSIPDPGLAPPDEDAPHGHYKFTKPRRENRQESRNEGEPPEIAYLEGKTDHTTKYGPSIDRLRLSIETFSPQIARIRITPWSKAQRWEIPNDFVPISQSRIVQRGPFHQKDWKAEIAFSDTADAGFAVVRESDSTPVFDSRDCPISYCDHYLEISTQLPKDTFVYGLGEVTGPFLREAGSRYAFWARDAQTPLHENAYSSLPIFLAMNKGKAFGVYLHNSNALDMVYDGSKITYKVVGGILDFFVYTGPSYEDVIQQHQMVTGFPRLPPYYSLGYHQCRWFYDTTEKLHESRTKNIRAQIPVDVFWLDIDFVKYIRDEMHAHNHKLVAILDPGVKCNVPDYKPWSRGVDLDVFIKNGNSKYPRDFVGKVWPGHVVFPDWTHPNIQKYWDEMFEEWLQIMPVDGIWHDMNECSNFVNGDVWEIGGDAAKDEILIPTGEETVEDMAKASANEADKSVDKDKAAVITDTPETPTGETTAPAQEGDAPEEPEPSGAKAKDEREPSFDPSKPISIRNPPYSINHGGNDEPLSARSISVESVHHNGFTEYELHNLFGHLNCKATYNTMTKLRPNERPFILTRSVFAGTGKYASKWLGDNFSTWESMRLSISGMLNMQIFGIPHIGADVGGFSDVPSEELLLRWFQLGSMYPFCRNHNMPNTPSQEAHISDVVARVAKKYLNLRYRLLPFWYTVFESVARQGGSVVQPVWAVYPPQTNSHFRHVLSNNNDEFLVGQKLLVLPVVQEGVEKVNAWIPSGLWYDIFTGEVIGSRLDNFMDLDAPREEMPIYVREGSVIPMHYQKSGKTTVDFRASGLSLLIVFDQNSMATGNLYLDDGATFAKEHSRVKFSALMSGDQRKIILTAEGSFGYAETPVARQEITVREVIIMGTSAHAHLTPKITPTRIILESNSSTEIDI
ncbi:hypothetical protein Dda_6124 [Drechslerella dactyloides]|uniref:alpha-glucosidase n=1 Tax=Drechslerella dactyloides TaxID=74499 RepID=A0AAD6NGZ0_DREDA|nr:hypothetical protein Dda_6124 [Drechslerella dactyloides]